MIFSGGPQALWRCKLGYSNVLFGLMMLEAFIPTGADHPYQSVFGFGRVRKIFVPFIMMLLIQICMPNVSFEGHLCGILSALFLYKTPLKYLFIPRIRWVKSFESKVNGCISCFEQKFTYYKAED